MPTSAVELLTPLGFGHANVVVAVPQAWIDVRTMADLDEVAADLRARHGRKMRVATKYVNLTRRFFAEHGVADYRIVESLGATEGAPAAGAAEIIVDITTTGATLAANALKVLDDGVILRSEANLVASLRRPGARAARAAAATVLDPHRRRGGGPHDARDPRRHRPRPAAGPRRDVAALRADPALRRRATAASSCCTARRARLRGRRRRSVAAAPATSRCGAVDYVFRPANPLTERLFAPAADDTVHRGSRCPLPRRAPRPYGPRDFASSDRSRHESVSALACAPGRRRARGAAEAQSRRRGERPGSRPRQGDGARRRSRTSSSRSARPGRASASTARRSRASGRPSSSTSSSAHAASAAATPFRRRPIRCGSRASRSGRSR